MRLFLAALAFAAALLGAGGATAQDAPASPASAETAAAPQSIVDRCDARVCKARLTPDQLINEVSLLITAKRFDEAEPMIAALQALPDHQLEVRFLSGMLAAGKGDHRRAAGQYKAILADDPGQTRVRLELAREMLAMGHMRGADKQFRLAQQDKDLPEDVARTIRKVRDVIRARRAWHFDIDLGIAPDTNINNATAADTVTILWGDTTLPLTLDSQAKARSGTGITATVSAGVRLPVTKSVALLADVDAAGNNYSGVAYDDYQAQIAAGAEIRVSKDVAISIEPVAAQRWYGGKAVSHQFGTKAGVQARHSDRAQLGVQLDLRRTTASFDRAYSGWQGGAYVTYERAVSKSLVVSAGVFGRRDWLKADAYSSTELGAIAGFGGELPKGFTFGLSGSASHAKFDAPMPLFSLEPRRDWRLSARMTLGNRKIQLLGFSPQIAASYSKTASNLDYYKNDRLRFRFTLARYF